MHELESIYSSTQPQNTLFRSVMVGMPDWSAKDEFNPGRLSIVWKSYFVISSNYTRIIKNSIICINFCIL